MGEVLGVSPQVCRGRWSELTPQVSHGIARLRVDVLVVEACRPHPELDERDLDASTEHLWIADGDVPVAYLRVVRDLDGVPLVDRACARPDVRRLGLATALVTDVVARHGGGPLRALTPREVVPFFRQQAFEISGSAVDAPAGWLVPMDRHPEAPWRY